MLRDRGKADLFQSLLMVLQLRNADFVISWY